MIKFNTVLLAVVTLILAIIRFTFVKDEFAFSMKGSYMAIAHVFVGGLIGAWMMGYRFRQNLSLALTTGETDWYLILNRSRSITAIGWLAVILIAVELLAVAVRLVLEKLAA